MYPWYIVLIHIILALILFFIVNWLGKRAEPMGYVKMSVVIRDDTAPLFNYLFKVLTPVVYIILLTAVFQKAGLNQLTSKIYFIVIYYWIIRLSAVILLGHIQLINWITQIVYWISSIALAIWFQSIVDKVNTILPDPQSLLEELWLLIIVFLYSLFNKMAFFRSGSQRRKERYINNQFLKFRRRYGQVVSESCKSQIIEAITYSVMIYENFNRPASARWLERILFARSKKIHSFGIMQVQSIKPLTDEESIKQGIEIVKNATRQYLAKVNEQSYLSFYGLLYEVSTCYNGGDGSYCNEIESIFDQVRSKYYHFNDLTYDMLLEMVGEQTKSVAA